MFFLVSELSQSMPTTPHFLAANIATAAAFTIYRRAVTTSSFFDHVLESTFCSYHVRM